MSAALDGALAYAARGWYVFPVTIGHDETKCADHKCKIVTPHGAWKSRSTTDPDRIRGWAEWGEGCNGYGIDCGKSGLVVADQDPGDKWPFKGTRVHQSGVGFHHIYTDDLFGLGNAQGLDPWGIDVRGVGGFLFGPGSWHPHGAYAVLDDIDPAPVPPELVEALLKRRTASEGLSAGKADGTPYAELDGDQRAAVDEAVEARLGRWRRLLNEAVDWPEGHRPYVYGEKRNKRGGWEQLSANFAWSMASLAAAPWSPYDEDEAKKLHDELLPEEIASNKKCADKFHQNIVKNAKTEADLTFRALTRVEDVFAGIDLTEDDDEPDRCTFVLGGERCPDGVWVLDHGAERYPMCQKHWSARNGAAGGVYLPDSFWEARPELTLIRQWAKARLAPPDATLACVISRVLGATPPTYVLPPYVGGIGSLNFFAGIVAPSGGGKGAAEATADACLEIAESEAAKEEQVGSGEGLLHAFASRKRGQPQFMHTEKVRFSVPEVDAFAKLLSRQGSTLGPVLRSAWSGETLGFKNAADETSIKLPAHSYRFAMVVGVQPGRGDALLNEDEVAGGTPQRFVWASGTDPDPDLDAEDPTERVVLTPPASPIRGGEFVVITTDDVVRDDIRNARVASLQGDKNAIGGHALFCREKVAAALALLAGRVHITADDWYLAGIVSATSDKVREGVGVELAKKAKERNIASGKAAGVQEVAKARVVDASKLQAATKAVLAKSKSLGADATRSKVRNGIRKDHREFFEQAVESLVAMKAIRVEPFTNRGQSGDRFVVTDEG